jgi:hypothetical protein
MVAIGKSSKRKLGQLLKTNITIEKMPEIKNLNFDDDLDPYFKKNAKVQRRQLSKQIKSRLGD